MRAGVLRYRVNLEHWVSTSVDNRGNAVGAWKVKIANLPCNIETLTGREGEVTHQQYPTATHKLTFQPIECCSERMRFKYGEKLFDIGFVDEFSDPMTCLATENKEP